MTREGPTMTNYERKGYDAWIELWAAHGCEPTASQCPARYMPPGEDRTAYLRGWSRAVRENSSRHERNKS